MIHRGALAWCVGFGIGLAGLDPAFAAAPSAGSREDSPAALVKREEDLLRQYRDLERSFLRLADLLAATDPRRSAVLRSVFDKARAEQVGDRFDTIVRLLEQGQLLKAGASQQSAIERCRALLDLLESGDGERRNADARKEVRQFLARLAKLIARQRDVEGSTDSGARVAELGERQAAVAEEARGLADEIGGFARRLEGRDAGDAADGSRKAGGEGEKPAADPGAPGATDESKASGGVAEGDSSEGGAEPPDAASDPSGDDDASRARRTERRLQSARQRMQAARERLDEARRTEARVEQDRALEELETARAELEEILRQMREQEVERLLVQLEARVRQMLKAQRQLLAAVESLAADPPGAQRERELEAARLGREQAAIGTEATKALTLVRDDGSAVAIPQALEGVRDDAAMASSRLARGDVAAVTRGLMGDLVTGLEELLAALEKAQRDAARERGAEAPGGRAETAGEQPLVDAIAEIRMLRSLQMRVNVRTRRFSQLIADGEEQADEPELVAALARLAERQREIQRAASDIVSGRTE